MKFDWRIILAGSSTDRGHIVRAVGEMARSVIGRCVTILLLVHTAGGVHSEDIDGRLIEFNIPQQQADKALTLFAEQANLTFVFPYELAQRTLANETVGTFSVSAAIHKLLEGTDLRPVFDAEGRLKIDRRKEHVEESEMNNREKAGIGALLSAMFAAPLAGAQDVSPGEEAIEEIVVTAQIREENFQDVPVTGTIFDGASLEANRLTQMDDIARFTPGFVVSTFNNSSPNFAIRGAMNTFSQAGASKPVGVFIDDVFVPRNSAAAFELFDIRQVSVLRGPQGTLFGRNVTAGAIQIYTAEPSLDAPEFKARAGIGSDSFQELAALVSGPLGNTVAGKISFNYQKRDGFNVDRFNGRELEDLDTLSVRAGLLIAPNDDLEIRLSADYSRDQNGGKGYSFVSSNDGLDTTGDDGNIRTSELRVVQDYDRDIAGLSAHVDWAIGGGTFQSITALRQSDSHDLYSLGAADVTLPSVSTQFIKDDNDDPTSFSQEFRYVSDVGDRFDFVAGAYYYDEDTDRFLGDLLLGADGNAVFVDRDFTVDAKTTSLAAYFSATLHLGDSFDVGIGGRYTREEKDVSVLFVDNNNAANNFTTSPSDDFSEFTPRITLTWFASDNVTLFASRTEGFTAGGFNTETNDIDAINLGFAPETIVAYELGAKTSWGDGRLRANLTLFDQSYEDKQEGFLLPGSFFSIFNASEATQTGAELELSWMITDALTANVTYSHLDATYDSFVIPGGDDYTGNKLQQAPDYTYSLALDYVRDIGSATMSAGISYTFQDDYFTGASNVPEFLIDSYALVNARVGYAWSDGRWSAQLWGKNLADEDFVRIRGTSGAIAEYFGPPRTYGLDLTYHTL